MILSPSPRSTLGRLIRCTGEVRTIPTFAGDLQRDLAACHRCGLWRNATQPVGGQGPLDAAIMLVGEQPGDAEDLAGAPFVGPAGRVLDEALRAAGLARERLYVTNAVKHFKHEMRGKRRLHKRPDTGEIIACRVWLDAERARVNPRVIVAMGATAALAVFGRQTPVLASRRKVFSVPPTARAIVTVHPAYLLRMRDKPAWPAALADFTDDLRHAAALSEAC